MTAIRKLNSRNLRTIATIGLSRPVFVHKINSIHLILLTNTLCTLHVVMLYCFRARAVISSLTKQTTLHLGKQKCKQVREPSRSRFSSTSNELRSTIPPNQRTGIGMALQTLVQTNPFAGGSSHCASLLYMGTGGRNT